MKKDIRISTTPTLEEVKKHFKNADECMSVQGNTFKNKPEYWDTMYYDEYNRIESCYIKDGTYEVWNSKKGYAKVISSIATEATFEEIIKPVMEWLKNNHHPHTMIEIDSENSVLWEGKKTFSRESFEVVKEDKFDLPKDFTGWAKHKIKGNENWTCYFKNGSFKYGIRSNLQWFELNEYCSFSITEKYREATNEEITEALTKEAVNRYKVGDYIKFLDNFIYDQTDFNKIDNINFIVSETFNSVFIESNGWNIGLFKDGKWAELQQTITKEQAEKELGKMIID